MQRVVQATSKNLTFKKNVRGDSSGIIVSTRAVLVQKLAPWPNADMIRVPAGISDVFQHLLPKILLLMY